MERIVIPTAALAVIVILMIQTVTVRITWRKSLMVGIDYMFFTFYYTVKKGKKAKKQKIHVTALISFAKELLSHSYVTLHRAMIEYSSDDYAEQYFKDGAIRGLIFSSLSAIRAFSKDLIIDNYAIQTTDTSPTTERTYLDISIKVRLLYVILSSFSFLKIYLKKKAKEAK